MDSRSALVVGEAVSFIFKANNVFDTLNLALVECGAIVEAIRISLVARHLLVYLADPRHDKHLVGAKNRLEALRQRGKV